MVAQQVKTVQSDTPRYLMAIVKDFFEYPSLNALKEDWVKLTEKDKQELREEFIKAGYAIKVDGAAKANSPLSEAPKQITFVQPEKDDEAIHVLPDTNGYAVGQEHPAAKAAA